MIIKGILTVFVFIFAILGICELIHTIRLIFLSPSGKNGMYSVLILKPNNAPQQVSFAAEQLNWLGGDFAECVIAVIDGISEQEMSLCRDAAGNGNIIFLSLNELPQRINKGEKDEWKKM